MANQYMEINRKNIEIGSFSAILAALVLIFSVSSYQRNSIWLSEFTLWQDAIIKSPLKSRPYIYTGIAYAKAKEYKEAYKFLSRAVIVNPTDIEAKYNLAILYRELNRYDLAEAELKRAITVRPDLKESYIALSELYFKQMRFASAAEILRRAIEKWPNYTAILLKLATANAQSGKIIEAEAQFKGILSLPNFQNNTEALSGLGNLYMLKGKMREALNLYERAISIDPAEPEPIYNAALTSEKLGEKERAIRYYALFIEAANASKEDYNDAVINARGRISYLKKSL
jgi:tetratricopeptide (TPR) repeat protein